MAVSALANAVSSMNCPPKPVSRSSRRKSMPDMSAILMSETMTSNSVAFACTRPSSALDALVTMKPCFLRKISSSSRIDRSSSTIRILARLGILLFSVGVSFLAAPCRACASPGRAAAGTDSLVANGRSPHALEINDYCGTQVLLRSYSDGAVVSAHNLIDDRKSQTRTVFERRVEWYKQTFELLFFESKAGILESNLRISIPAL